MPKAARRSLNRLPAAQNEDAEMEEIGGGEIEGERANEDVQIEEQPAQENMVGTTKLHISDNKK